MKLPRGYRVSFGAIASDRRSVQATVHVAWWRVLLIRLFGRRGA
jgi:hypothetical protein